VFSNRINTLNKEGKTPCRVTHFWDPGNHEWQHPAGPEQSAKDVAKWREDTIKEGAVQVNSLDELLKNVDGVLVLNINGHRHLELAIGPIARGMPTYIDKPLTCSLDQARSLLNMTRQYKARCYSASSLRFITEIPKLDKEKVGDIVAIDAFGNGELLDMMPHLWHYGCHSIEMVDAIFKWSGQGPGVARVSAIATNDYHLLDMQYRDGRIARLRMDRVGAWAFGATIHGTKGVQQFVVDFGPVYTKLVEGMVKFFEGGEAPVDLRDIVENVAVMEAGNRSIAAGGEWMDIPEIK
ncbi:MAG: Gfo/Idh/MocA family protein, partial [Phycisphaerales bacterium]